MTEDQILYEKDDGIGIITLNRPEKLNACTFYMYQRLAEIQEEIKGDDSVRVVILTGAGRGFCAGADLSGPESGLGESRERPSRIRIKHSTLDRRIGWGMLDVPKITIAAINGPAVGVGAEYTLHCDIRIAAESARWGQVFVLRAWVPDTGAGTYLLSRIVGLSNALDLVCSGDIIDAQEMLRIGLVSKVVPNDQLMTVAKETARRFMRGSPLAIRNVKELIYRSLERNIEEHLQASSSIFSMLTASEDHAEGVKAFLEKREPEWKGK
ncbi:MAG TPA: enoyl-CoA hydratase/isomerase family protein [Dehalococcoidia bacterium]|nr:enoyl-CoA hydratase/isomerase family protein [Dehalococcoidia bacterium]